MGLPMPLSRRFVLKSVSMLAIGMATPAFSIDIPNVTLSLLGESDASHRFEERRHQTADGRRYRVLLAIPKAASPPAGNPIIYMLDGNAAFAALTVERLAAVPNLIVAAIGYEGDKAFDVDARSRDYTPPLPGQTAATPDPQRPGRLVGGAPVFLDTLTGEMRTLVETGLSVDGARRTLWGHSYGGLFTLYTLFSQPNAFAAYVPVSPSMWWGEGSVEHFEQQAPRRQGAPAGLLVMLGDSESRSNQPRLEQPQPAPATMALIERLSQRDDLQVSSRVLEGAQHGQTLSLSLPFALHFAATL
jgi:predicted alpha/beta superfamily hydrolase